MDNPPIELKEWGWNDWFEERAACRPSETVARVAAVDRDQLLLINQDGPFRAVLAGRYLYRHPLPEDSPCVGDWVCVARQPGDDRGLIHALLPRRTALRRRSAGDAVETQMIAANVDTVIIVGSCHVDFSVNRLERYLVMVRDGGSEPWILLTKTDLVEPAVLAAQRAEIRAAGIDAPVLELSNVTHDGIEDLRRRLRPGTTACFVGSSGVGKSTLINHLLGRQALDTGAVAKTGEGRHTTVRRELLRLESGALVIDNPGMREFGILDAEGGIAGSFADIDALASGCRYRDCTHLQEPGCAVLEALESGQLNRDHYENFTKLRDESEFYRMSSVEKRRKERDFGRYLKSAKKDLKHR